MKKWTRICNLRCERSSKYIESSSLNRNDICIHKYVYNIFILYRRMTCNTLWRLAIVNVRRGVKVSGEAFFCQCVEMCTSIRGDTTYLCVRDFSSDRCVIDFRIYVHTFTCTPRNEANKLEWNEWKIVYDVV